MRYLAFFMALFLFSLPVTARAEMIRITADVWCPYNCDPKSEHPGYMIEIALRAFARHGIGVDYVVQPWTRAIGETRKGKFTAIVGGAIHDAPDFIFPDTLEGMAQNVFYVKKANAWRYSGINSLNDVTLGVIAKYSYNDELDAYIQANKDDPKHLDVTPGDGALNVNFRKLTAGVIGALVENKSVAQYYINQHKIADQVEEAGLLRPSDADNLYIAFGPTEKNAKKYAAILSQEMKAMRASGELKQILAAYGLKDWEK